MRALTVHPGVPDSARVDEIAEPPTADGPVLVEMLAVGVCGTDLEIVEGQFGTPPPGDERLVLGHESLGRVLEAPPDSGLAAGDLVVGIVRRPDPAPCACCAVDEWDMCRNGHYTERGIKALHGYCAERVRIEPAFAVKLPPGLDRIGMLVEPASVVAKAWEQIERIGQRAAWFPRSVLVTGAGPIGLLAALLGVQRGLEVHVLDRVTSGPKPQLVRDLGATYHTGDVAEACPEADIILECTGVGQIVLDAMRSTSAGGIVCLTGISSGKRLLEANLTALNRDLVLENAVVFGTVNANRRHYEAAVSALARADQAWLERLITRRVPLQGERWREAVRRAPDDVKTVIELSPSPSH